MRWSSASRSRNTTRWAGASAVFTAEVLAAGSGAFTAVAVDLAVADSEASTAVVVDSEGVASEVADSGREAPKVVASELGVADLAVLAPEDSVVKQAGFAPVDSKGAEPAPAVLELAASAVVQ